MHLNAHRQRQMIKELLLLYQCPSIPHSQVSKAILQPNRSRTNVSSASPFGAAALRPFNKPLLHSFRNRKQMPTSPAYHGQPFDLLHRPRKALAWEPPKPSLLQSAFKAPRLVINNLSVRDHRLTKWVLQRLDMASWTWGWQLVAFDLYATVTRPGPIPFVFKSNPSAYPSLTVGHHETSAAMNPITLAYCQ